MAPAAALAVQVVAAASVPVIVLGVVVSQLSRGQPLTWRHAKMATMLCLAPALLVLAVRGLLTRWIALLAVLIVIVLGLLVGSGGD